MTRWRLVAALVGAIAFANAAAWALITPALMGPDEEAHVAYAEQLAQGHVPDSDPRRSFASTDMRYALTATRHYAVIFAAFDTRPPWERADERAYHRAIAHGPARDDGGGPTGASGNSPIYYALPAAASRIGGGSFFDRLLLMRLMSALLAGVAAAFVCATIRELAPGLPWAAPTAGLLVAFQPMFGFIHGTVNPDAGAAAGGAVLLYLLVRALRRGLTTWAAVGIAAALALGTLAKFSVLALAPAVALALFVTVRRRAAPRKALVALAAGVGGLVLAWAILALALDRDALPGLGGQAIVPTPNGPTVESVGVVDRLTWLWQVFLPPLPFMDDLFTGRTVPAAQFYLRSLWASFGWLNVNPPYRVYLLIAAALGLVLVLAAVGARREWPAVRSRGAELGVLVLAAISLAVVTHLNFGRAQPGPFVLEQGRYLFPVAATGAVVAVGACFAFGRRWAPVVATALVAAMMVFSGLCQLFVFTAYYT
jgi:4-amino-4-deoxy-L-arabinose transferase-like glycosyltransferase